MQTNPEINQIIKNISQVNKAIYENMCSRDCVPLYGTRWSLFTGAFAIFKVISKQEQLIRMPNLEIYLQGAIDDLTINNVSQDLINNLQINFNLLKTYLIEQKRVENEQSNSPFKLKLI